MRSALIVGHDQNSVDEGDRFGLEVSSPTRNGNGQFKTMGTEPRFQIDEQFLKVLDLGFAFGVFPIDVGAVKLMLLEKGRKVADEGKP